MLNGAPIEFELVKDVPDGGVLFALPALLLLGLLSKSREMFSMPEGFYPLESIFLLLALMALARIPSLEALRYVAPGEWGKLMGLDRIPEVRTLRQKITQLCSEQGLAERWSNALAKQWMAQEPECAGVFYADGHVRVYHGKLTDLPRRYIARERLCLRGTTDYWVNAAKTDYSTVNCSNSHKSSCPKKWSPDKSKPISTRRVNCSRPLKNAAPKSSNLKPNPKRFPNTSRSKISLSKIASIGGPGG